MVGFTMATLFVNSNSRFGSESPLDDPHHYHSHDMHDPHSGSALHGVEGPEQDVGHHSDKDEAHAFENTTIATKLFDEVKVLCWVMTNPKNHKSKARHVKRTWGPRCNKLIFMSTQEGEQ